MAVRGTFKHFFCYTTYRTMQRPVSRITKKMFKGSPDGHFPLQNEEFEEKSILSSVSWFRNPKGGSEPRGGLFPPLWECLSPHPPPSRPPLGMLGPTRRTL